MAGSIVVSGKAFEQTGTVPVGPVPMRVFAMASHTLAMLKVGVVDAASCCAAMEDAVMAPFLGKTTAFLTIAAVPLALGSIMVAHSSEEVRYSWRSDAVYALCAPIPRWPHASRLPAADTMSIPCRAHLCSICVLLALHADVPSL